MKREANHKISHSVFLGALFGTVTAIVTTVGCSSKPKPAATLALTSPTTNLSVSPVAPKSVAFTADGVPTKPVEKPVAKKDKTEKSKATSFKSRDYGVSFQYPWQYTRVGAKAIANDDSLQPQSDGLDGQMTLVRIDIPKGFYPDTDFDSGYFTLSIDPGLKKDECDATLKSDKDAKPQLVNINGLEYRWVETSSGGQGESAKVRDYAGFANDTCYELETGVKTKNDGLSREVDPDQVLRRLDPMLVSVKVDSAYQSPESQQLQSEKKDENSNAGK
jgi:hypothetical protein